MDVGTGVWVGEWDSQMKGRADRKPKSIMGKITSSCAKWPLFGKGLEFSFVFGLVCGEFVPCKFSTRVPFVSWHLNRPSPFVLPPTLYVPPKKKGKNELKSEREYEHLVHSIMASAEHPLRLFPVQFRPPRFRPLSVPLPPFASCSGPGSCRCMRYAWVEPMWPFRLMYTEHVAC